MLTDVVSVLRTEKRAVQKRLKLVNEADPGWLQNEVLP